MLKVIIMRKVNLECSPGESKMSRKVSKNENARRIGPFARHPALDRIETSDVDC